MRSSHAVPIGDVWQMLGGGRIERGHARAWWGDSGDRTIVIDARSDTWSDPADGTGGAVVDLIAIVRGCSHADAALWLDAELNLAVWTAIISGDISPAELLLGDAA